MAALPVWLQRWNFIDRAKLERQLWDAFERQEDLQALGMRVEPFLPVDGERAGRLWPLTRQQGLSLADRACLSLALRLGLTVVTCDRAWAQLPLDQEVQLLR